MKVDELEEVLGRARARFWNQPEFEPQEIGDLRALVAAVERQRDAIRWALGEIGEFPGERNGRPGAFYWRSELCGRAALSVSPSTDAGRTDDPELDATDFAHPAWWRGHEHTTRVFCIKVNAILDGKDDGTGLNYEPWGALRRRLLSVTAALRAAQPRIPEPVDGMSQEPNAVMAGAVPDRVGMILAWLDRQAEMHDGFAHERIGTRSAAPDELAVEHRMIAVRTRQIKERIEAGEPFKAPVPVLPGE